jgi:hypothetical protein
MQIPPEVLKCVVFVGYRMADGSTRYAGTGFFIGRATGYPDKHFSYLVTARHVIDGIRDKGIDSVLLRMNQKSDKAAWFSTKLRDWKMPEDESIDVAVIPYGIPQELDHLTWPADAAVTTDLLAPMRIGVGDDVFIAGLFTRHAGKNNNIPIVRVGNIAAFPYEKVPTRIGDMHAYLVEARSIGGLSGSPVFVHLGGDMRTKGFAVTPIRYFLIGLMHGHFQVDANSQDVLDAGGSDKINMGIGIVVPIDEVVRFMSAFDEYETKILAEMAEQQLPVMDSTAEAQADFTKADFENALRKVSKRVQPSQSDEGK